MSTSSVTSSDPKTPLQQFYSEKSVFITGGTGFLGKILVEKLLRSCSGITSIYILIRPKKDKDADQRLQILLDDPVFGCLKKKFPNYSKKVFAVPGDTTLPGLGISDSHKQIIREKVTIIFNVAANVKFDERLEDAVAVNISSAKEILEFSLTIENLKAFIHVSTLFSNCSRDDIDEILYPPPLTGENTLKLVEILDQKRLENATRSLLGDFPNTYTFTKCIAEDIIQHYRKNLPIGIFRPAIVTSTYKEPVSGWVDNLNGATGALAGAAAGVVKVWNSDLSCHAELVPADLTVNALVTTAWDVATNHVSDSPIIYNYHSTWTEGITWGKYLTLALKYGREFPSSTSKWYFTLISAKSFTLYYLYFMLLHIIPAVILDTGRLLSGKKPKVIKMYKNIHKSCMAVSYFSRREWNVQNRNVRRMWDKLDLEDRDLFFFSMDHFDWDDFVKKSFQGYRTYLFKDDPDNLPMARKRMAKIYMAHCLIKYTFYAVCIWIVYRIAITTSLVTL